jgi:hypothetical protein
MKQMFSLLTAFLLSNPTFATFAQESAPEPSGASVLFKRFFKPHPVYRAKAARAETWQLFPAGTLPIGKAVTEKDAVNLAARDYSAESLYLVGSFVVTASSGNLVILRPTAKGASFRVIVHRKLYRQQGVDLLTTST